MSVSVACSCWCSVLQSFRINAVPVYYHHLPSLHFALIMSSQEFSTKGMAEYSHLSHDKSLQTSLFEPNCQCMHHFPFNNTVYSNVPGSGRWENWRCRFLKWLSPVYHSLRSSLKYLDQKNSIKATSGTRLTRKVTGNEIYNQKLISEIRTTPNNSLEENLHVIGDDSRYRWHLVKFAVCVLIVRSCRIVVVKMNSLGICNENI